MLNFEASNYANGSSTEFIDWQGNEKVTSSYFERFPEARKKFLRSFEKNYPELVADRNVVLIDCTTFVDPGHDRSLRSTWVRIMKVSGRSSTRRILQRSTSR